MADQRITEMPPANPIQETDLLAIVQDLATTPDTRKGSAIELGSFVINNETLVQELAVNTIFVSALTQNDTFVTELISNETFVQELATNSTFLTELSNNPTFINNIITEISAEDVWVNTEGDTMTGNLYFLHEDDEPGKETVFQPLSGGGYNISPIDLNDTLYLAVSTADQTLDVDGAVIAGRFRCAIPMEEKEDEDLLTSSDCSSALIQYAGGAGGTLIIRKNDGTAGMDFFLGNYFSVVTMGSEASVTLEPETPGVHLLVPDGFIASPRGRYSVITATLVRADVTDVGEGDFTHDDEYWLISGDLAVES